MNDILNEKEFLEGIKSEIRGVYKKIDKMYDLIIERVEYKKVLVKKFEESVTEEYEYESINNDEMQRVEKFGEVIKEIVGL